MKNHLLFIIFSLLLANVYAQTYSVKIEEDYTNPKSAMWEPGSEYYTGTIENGMYVSKPGRMHAQLKFGYSLYDMQREYITGSVMEYTIVKLKGNKEDFIRVQIDPNGDKAYPYLVFWYNELGDWKLTNYLEDKTYSSGKATVNAAPAGNVIKIEHRYNTVTYYVNNVKVTELKSDNNLEIRWYNNKIYSKNTKFVLGLDKVFLAGGITEKTSEVKKEEAVADKQQQKPEYDNQYTSWGIKIKTQTHSLYVYPGWGDIFKGAENAGNLLFASYGNKQPSEILREAPEGWLKDEPYLSTLHIKFEDIEEYTLDKYRENFFDMAMRRSELSRDKIRPVEEQVTLPGGRKGIVLFYVCPDARGMIGGNYLNCELAVPSEKNPGTITSYNLFVEGVPDLEENKFAAWKDYFKKVLLTIRPI